MNNDDFLVQYDKYYTSLLENDTDVTQKIKQTIDISTYEEEDQLYNNYPDYNNPNFIYEISNKLEFAHMKTLFNITDISNKCPKLTEDKNDFQFELSNNQQFLKNFMNKKTPYKGLVIFHGVGVGKTCSAINISSSYRDIYMTNREKIICLVPKNIRGGWENTIYDPKKGKEQCSGDNFEDIINSSDKKNILKKDVRNMIKNYYEFHGYLKFANSVRKIINKEIGNQILSEEEKIKKEQSIIKKHFSNRILIIDEIHNLREENDDTSKTDTTKKLKKGKRVSWENERGVLKVGTIISSEKDDQGNYYYYLRDQENDDFVRVSSENINKLKEEDKKARETIEKVIDYSEGLRIILLSATPMFNKSNEIIWLLNLLLKNDNRPTINYDDIFKKSYKKGDILKEEGIEIIKQKSKGYFSYLRGENPISFPIRFYPDINYELNCMGGDHHKKDKNGKKIQVKYIDYPKLSLFSIKGEHIPLRKSIHTFQFMKLYNTLMNDVQKNIYISFINTIQKKTKKTLRLSDRNIGLQLSNISYTNSDHDKYTDSFGKQGFNKIFKEKIEKKMKKCSYINTKEPILDFENIQYYSCKINNILENMLKNKTKGIIFIYSDFIYSGILPLAIALEHIGFQKFGGKNILDYPEWKPNKENTKNEPIDHNFEVMGKSKNKKRANYIILTGDKSLSNNNELERKASLHENNINGENIKVILGNTVTSEGMDFKNIREIHVLDPWYHLYKIEQIIGRGIRYCSHSLQPKEKQNVTVYLHTSSIEHTIESVDTNTYRIAEEKAFQIGKIEKILKENSVDCFLNQQINSISGLKDINMITTWNKHVTTDINDKIFTKVCSFSPNKEDGCKINCNISKEKLKLLEKMNNEDINDDTFSKDDISDSIQIIYKIIKELYEKYNSYDIEELIRIIQNTIDTNRKIILHALEDIKDNKLTIWNKNNTPGYIININTIYLFQPFSINDENVPYFYRSKKINSDSNKYHPKIKWDIVLNKTNVFNCSFDYNTVYEIIKDNIDNSIRKDFNIYKKFIDNIQNDVLINHYIDSLNYEYKTILLKEILCGFISTNGKKIQDEYDKIIFTFFQNNLIYESNDNYHILEKKGKVIGFFLCNTQKYHRDKNVFDNFDFYIYEKNQWKLLDNVGLQILKNNFSKNKNKDTFFKKSEIWGYSFKEDNNHIFKIVDNQIGKKNNEPGKVIGNKGVKPVSLLKDFSSTFKGNFVPYIKNLISLLQKDMSTNQKDIFNKKIQGESIDSIIKIVIDSIKRNKKYKYMITKDFITLMFEYSLRTNYTYFNYDLFLLQFYEI